MRDTMQRRIREGFTISLEKLDANSDFWDAFKAKKGFLTEPLQMTGEMTKPAAFNIRIIGDNYQQLARRHLTDFVAIELASKHQEKWDNIHEIAENTGKNWNQAWWFGKLELEAVLVVVYAAIASAGGTVHD